MSKLRIYIDRIIKNVSKMNDFCNKHGKEWTFVTKVLGGNKPVLKNLLKSDVILGTHSIGDSRVSNLKVIKSVDPNLVTMYLKPPSTSYVKSVIKYADISLNTDYNTIYELNNEAKIQHKNHKVIIMIEMGELREGVVRDRFLDFYSKVFDLPNIEIIGLGTNLGCMYGIEPTFDKLIQLCLYEQLIETRFKRDLNLVSGGSSITLPLLSKGKVPKGVNHLRIGEAIFLGTSPFTGKKFSNLSTNAFEFCGDIVELEKKEKNPDGVIGNGNVGHVKKHQDSDNIDHEYKAVLDFGVVDVDIKDITSKDISAHFVGTTSDLTVYGLGLKSNKYEVGDSLKFNPDYMAVARLMNSKFVEKEIL